MPKYIGEPHPDRAAFEHWYATQAFDYARNPIGSNLCADQWAAWKAARTHPPKASSVEFKAGAGRFESDRLDIVEFPDSPKDDAGPVAWIWTHKFSGEKSLHFTDMLDTGFNRERWEWEPLFDHPSDTSADEQAQLATNRRDAFDAGLFKSDAICLAAQLERVLKGHPLDCKCDGHNAIEDHRRAVAAIARDAQNARKGE